MNNITVSSVYPASIMGYTANLETSFFIAFKSFYIGSVKAQDNSMCMKFIETMR